MLITIHPTGPSRFSATLNDRTVVQSSRTPMLDTARVLIAEGADPRTELAMKHAGSTIIAMRGRLDRLAGLAVRDDDRGPRFERYRAHPGEMPIAEPPVSRQRQPATDPTLASS